MFKAGVKTWGRHGMEWYGDSGYSLYRRPGSNWWAGSYKKVNRAILAVLRFSSDGPRRRKRNSRPTVRMFICHTDEMWISAPSETYLCCSYQQRRRAVQATVDSTTIYLLTSELRRFSDVDVINCRRDDDGKLDAISPNKQCTEARSTRQTERVSFIAACWL